MNCREVLCGRCLKWALKNEVIEVEVGGSHEWRCKECAAKEVKEKNG